MKVGLVIATLLVCCFSSSASGQQAKLEGHVFDEQDNRVRSVRIVAPGGQATETDSRGHFLIAFPSLVEPGQATRIEVTRAGWVIYEPMLGNCVTQSTARNFEPLKVIIVRKGSPLALSPKRLARVIAQWSDERAKLRGQVSRYKSQLDEYAFIREYSEKYGFTLDQFLETAQQWARSKESDDTEEQALKEYFLKNYDRAAHLARESALAADTELERVNEQRVEAGRKVIRRFKLEGNAFYEQNKYREALTAYEEINKRFTGRKFSKEDLIEEWAEIKLLIGSAKNELGTRVEGREGQQLLSESATEHRSALTVYTREHLPQQWATTQANLGLVLHSQARRLEGEEGARLLGQSVEAYRAALTVYTRQHLPQQWAATQSNLGNALLLQGMRLEGEERLRLLGQSVEASRAALTVYTREHLPQQWAETQSNLGNALRSQGELVGREEGARLLGQAAEAFRAALTVLTREHLPQQWAMVQINLAIVLRLQGMQMEGEEGARLLGQSVEAFRAALQVRTREHLPQQWAMVQINLGNALVLQGMRLKGEEGARLLGQAAEALRAALTVLTREHLPQQWAATQANLGNALALQGIRLEGVEGARLLGQSVEAFRAALQVRTREHLPQQWAMTQNSLAETYFRLRNWHGAAESYSNILTLHPDNEEAYSRASIIYHESLFEFDKAFALNQRWLARHPEDISAQGDFAEKHLTTGRFTECVQHINSLLSNSKIDANSKTVLRAIEIASLLALKQNNQVPVKIRALIEEVSRQPADFKISWLFDGTRHFIGQNEMLAPHRAWLGRLFDALAGKDRDTILSGLRQAALSFEEPGAYRESH